MNKGLQIWEDFQFIFAVRTLSSAHLSSKISLSVICSDLRVCSCFSLSTVRMRVGLEEPSLEEWCLFSPLTDRETAESLHDLSSEKTN